VLGRHSNKNPLTPQRLGVPKGTLTYAQQQRRQQRWLDQKSYQRI
jgi:hypothetical protein